MEIVGSQTIWGLYATGADPEIASNTVVRKSPGHVVKSYVELAQKVAALQFLNREHVLLFRGQSTDYRTSANLSTMKPTIFRSRSHGKVPSRSALAARFSLLRTAEERLLQRYSAEALLGADRLARHRLLRWSILQHYDVCATPLLDVSQSLRVAASFATSDDSPDAFVCMFWPCQILAEPSPLVPKLPCRSSGFQAHALPLPCDRTCKKGICLASILR